MNDAELIEQLVADEGKFRDFIYTPLSVALAELDRRSSTDPAATDDERIPHVLKNGKKKAVIFRHVATPNHEIRRFVGLVDGFSEGLIDPLIFEYHSDKFTNLNEWKYSLGKLPFHKTFDKKGNLVFEQKSVVDFNTSNNKSIGSVNTLWGQSLVDFHHELFCKSFPHLGGNFFDLSEWIKENGQTPVEYYKHFFNFFVRHGILFENFLLKENETTFTKNVIIPAFLDVWHKTGLRPLIVPLEPTDIEDNYFWLCQTHYDKDFVVDKIKNKVLPIEKDIIEGKV